jgi:DNA-binding helix-hairpin-helix protein with protein kinase domain
LELISGFGTKLIKRLFDWRRQCELAFVFDAAKDVSQVEIQKVDRDILTKRSKLEQELSKKIGHLKVISHQITERRKQMHSQGLSLIDAYVQAAVDAHEVEINVWR